MRSPEVRFFGRWCTLEQPRSLDSSENMRTSLFLCAVAAGFTSAPVTARHATVSSFTIHRLTVNGTVDRTFISGATAPVSVNERSLSLTVKGSLLDLSTGADVVDAAGSVVSGSSVQITRRQGGADTQIDLTVTGLTGKAPGSYRVRVHYAVETNGPDLVRLRLLASGEVTSLTRDAGAVAGVYLIVGQLYTMRAGGSFLDLATIDATTLPGMTATIVSRSSSSLVFTLRFNAPGRYSIIGSSFYDENLGHVPTLSDEVEMGVRYSGTTDFILVVNAPTITSVTPQPATATGTVTMSGANLSGGGLSLAKVRFGHRYRANTETLFLSDIVHSPTSVSMPAAYDIESAPLELEFAPEAVVKAVGRTDPPPYVLSVPFRATYGPTLLGVFPSAEQASLSSVRVLRPGTMAITGKYLFGAVGTKADPLTSISTTATTVRLGGLVFPIATTIFVAPTASVAGRDSVRVTVADPTDNVSGQIRVETGLGSVVTSGDFVLVTRPRVTQLSQITTTDPLGKAISTQTLFRGEQYQISGTSLSVKNGTQVLQVGTVRFGARVLTSMPTTDPGVALRFLVPLDAVSDALIVATAGGETTVGKFVVSDPPAGSVPTPRPTLLAIAPSSVASGVGATGTVTLDNPGASIDHFSVALSSSDTSAATVPAAVSVPGTSGTFAITTKSVTAARTVTITASSGGAKQSQSFSVTPAIPVSLVLSSNDVVSGATVNGTVTFSAAAPGATVTLSSSDAAAPVPSSVSVSGSSAVFSILTTEAPAPRTVTITAAANGTTKSATVNVNPLRIQTAISPETIRMGQTATLTATVSRAPAADVQLTVATSNPSLVQFDQAVLLVRAGQTSGTIGLRVVSAPATQTTVPITTSRSVMTAGFGTVTITSARSVTVTP